MSKTKWEEWLEKNEAPKLEERSPDQKEVRPWDFLKPGTEYASKEKKEERYSICKSCPEFIKLTSQCKKCGCFMAAKTALEQATCPLNKW